MRLALSVRLSVLAENILSRWHSKAIEQKETPPDAQNRMISHLVQLVILLPFPSPPIHSRWALPLHTWANCIWGYEINYMYRMAWFETRPIGMRKNRMFAIIIMLLLLLFTTSASPSTRSRLAKNSYEPWSKTKISNWNPSKCQRVNPD